MEQGVWQEIELLYQKFQKLGISEAVDYDKYYLYSLITHSTAIEGSTLTELDTQLLFDEGVTAKGKPLVHHLMNEDLKQAYELAKVESDSLVPITPAFLKRMNAMLMRTTGSVHSVLGGSFDSSKGEFRLCGVTAGFPDGPHPEKGTFLHRQEKKFLQLPSSSHSVRYARKTV